MISEKLNFEWYCLSRAEGLADKTIEKMAKAGCKSVNCGVESADPHVLKNMDKRININKAKEQFETYHQNGIMAFGSFIVGFPGETSDSLKRTIDFINTSKFDKEKIKSISEEINRLYKIGRKQIHDDNDRSNSEYLIKNLKEKI